MTGSDFLITYLLEGASPAWSTSAASAAPSACGKRRGKKSIPWPDGRPSVQLGHPGLLGAALSSCSYIMSLPACYNRAVNVFLSWSGERSWAIAGALHNWLPYMVSGVKPFMSDRDIYAGAKWATELSSQLEQSNVAVLCLTPENLQSPWLMFEAGAVSKAGRISKIIPVRFMLSDSEISFPLAQFQSVDAGREGLRRLVQTINTSLPEPRPEHQQAVLFEKFWGDLDIDLQKVRETAPSGLIIRRSEKEMLIEMLELLRSLSPGSSRTTTRIELPFPLLKEIESADGNSLMEHAQSTRDWITTHAESTDKRIVDMVVAYSSEIQAKLTRTLGRDSRFEL